MTSRDSSVLESNAADISSQGFPNMQLIAIANHAAAYYSTANTVSSNVMVAFFLVPFLRGRFLSERGPVT